MKRKHFIQNSILSFLALMGGNLKTQAQKTDNTSSRDYWASLLLKMATPILKPMSEGKLRKTLKVEVSPSWGNRNRDVAYLEAFGRIIVGVAPFIELPEDNTPEGKKRKQLKTWAQKSLAHAVDPNSPDYLTWYHEKSNQYLVDAAFLANAILYAPKALWEELPQETKSNTLAAFAKIRKIKPNENNWLLFAAICEAAMLKVGDQNVDLSRIHYAIDKINSWYIGDGWYSDGPKFHFDYYNGFVIQPMLVDILRLSVAKGIRKQEELDLAEKRMQRFSHFLERMISPEGTYPVFGRSSTYRLAGFQPLAKNALEHSLPAEISPAQVRCALTKVMKNVFIPESFTADGFLTLGLVGNKQMDLADYYSNTGSMYLTSTAFLPLGLPANDAFWKAKDEEWTAVKIWKGKPFPKDYAVDY